MYHEFCEKKEQFVLTIFASDFCGRYYLNLSELWKLSLISSAFLGFLLTPVDPKWPSTSMITLDLLYWMWYTFISNMKLVQVSLFEISQVYTIWPLLTPNDLHQKEKSSCIQCVAPTYKMWDLFKPPFLTYYIQKLGVTKTYTHTMHHDCIGL